MKPKFTASILELIICQDITSCSPLACHQTTRSHIKVHLTSGFEWNVLFQRDKRIRWRDIIFQANAWPQFWRRESISSRTTHRPLDPYLVSLFFRGRITFMISQRYACSLSTFETNYQISQNFRVRKNLTFRGHLSLVHGNFLQPILTTWQAHGLKKWECHWRYSICRHDIMQSSRFSTYMKVLSIISIWHLHEIYFSIDLTAVINPLAPEFSFKF